MQIKTLTLSLALAACCAAITWAGPPERGLATPWDGDATVFDNGSPNDGGGGLRASDWYVATTGDDTSGDGSQGNPWRTIKYAISQAGSGDTIHVASGTYVETGQIVVGINLTIVGDPANKPVVKTDQDTGSAGDARGWWLVNTGVVLNIEYLAFDGTGYKIWQAFRHKGSGSFTDCAFDEIKYEESGPSFSGVAVCAFGDGPVNVTRCELEEIGRIGVFYFGSGVAGSICDHIQYTGFVRPFCRPQRVRP